MNKNSYKIFLPNLIFKLRIQNKFLDKLLENNRNNQQAEIIACLLEKVKNMKIFIAQ